MNTKRVLLTLLVCGASALWGRETLSLDGAWSFRTDPADIGAKEAWFSSAQAFPDSIEVPGAWDAQGVGGATDKLRHNFVGAAWYKKEVALPAAWSGMRVFLCVEGVHRSAAAWVDDEPLGDHAGYLSPWELEVPPALVRDGKVRIALRVDSRQDWTRDCLTGCIDIIDEMFTVWGGLWGRVRLEARSDAWLEGLFLAPDSALPGFAVSAAIGGDAAVATACRFEAFAPDGKLLTAVAAPVRGASVAVACPIPEAKLWTPDAPYLYTGRLTLRGGDAVLDRAEARAGIRRIEIRGPCFYLNGKKLFLRGYGDDSVYPATMAPPANVDVYRARLEVAKRYGFNFVRHHSHFLPPEYYDAADEVGMLISPELPIAYLEYYARAKGPSLELYAHEWAAAITRLRNHPSIFDWCMGNEMWDGVPIAPELYRLAKTLDPTRPVIDSDGLWPAGFLDGTRDRPTLDFYSILFDEWALPLEKPGKHRFEGVPKKPVISHETGNYVTWPRLDLIDAFTHNFVPFWLLPVKEQLARQGLRAESERWARNSERLYLLSHKLNLEDMRKNSRISGYEWWLLQDYWTGSNGIVDAYFRPKDVPIEAVRYFNDAVVILVDGLAPACRAGDTLRLAFSVSNYGEEALDGATLHCTVVRGSRSSDAGTFTLARIPQGEVVPVARAEVPIEAVDAPERVSVRAELRAGGTRRENSWYTWAYPPAALPVRARVPIFAGPDQAEGLARFGAAPLPSSGALPAPAVYAASQPNARMLDAVARGATLVCLAPQGLFPSVTNRFKPAWWLGNANDNNAGTVVYEHPLTRAIAPEGWCDLGWHRLLEGAQAYVLDDLPAQPELLVRALDVHSVRRTKSVLFQAKVGAGALIVSGLNLEPAAGAPEAEWLLAALLACAASAPAPRAELPRAWLEEKIANAAAPEGPFFGGFGRLLTKGGEESRYASYREDDAPLYVCRQTEEGRALAWETAPLSAEFDGERATFVFAGGLGWQSQPHTPGFTLALEGGAALQFDICREFRVWRGEGVTLHFVPKKLLPEDALGLFYLTVERARLAPGKPCRVTVTSRGNDSRRWFALNPYADLVPGR